MLLVVRLRNYSSICQPEYNDRKVEHWVNMYKKSVEDSRKETSRLPTKRFSPSLPQGPIFFTEAKYL